MILSRFVFTKLSPSNVEYWKSKGYPVFPVGGRAGKNTGKRIKVQVSDLKPGSNSQVSCRCDLCGQKYLQRYSRNTDVCSSCRRKILPKGNTHGKKNSTIKSPPKRELEEILQTAGKAEIARKYNTTLIIVSRWLKENNIETTPYQGIKKYDIESRIEEFKKDCQTLNREQILEKYNIPKHTLLYYSKKYSVNPPEGQFDIWKKEKQDVLKNFDFYYQENKNGKTLLDISNEYNVSVEHLKQAFREKNVSVILHSYNKSKGEIELKEWIKSLGFNCDSTLKKHNNKVFEIDCFVSQLNLGIEYCGEFLHCSYNKHKNYHQDKYFWCREQNIDLITIFEHEWLYKKEIVKSIIQNKLGLSKKIYGRKTKVKYISSDKARDFHEKNHISGYVPSSINIGLFHEEILVSVLSFVKARYSKKTEYEISRFSSLLNHTVIGGFSKMMKFSHLDSVQTYADLRFGNGKVYEKNGFEFIKTSIPNYFYYNKKTHERFSRIAFQKHKLKNFSTYDENLTEEQIVLSEGSYYKIYDCGNNYFEYKKGSN